jgi:predicted acylesterase/phospholipase RssA
MRGIAHIGALEVLQERGLLRAVREYIGVSAGSFCAFAICIGCTLSELRMVISMLDFGLMRSINPEDVFHFMETYGFDSGENMEKLVAVLLKTKGLPVGLTFKGLAALGRPRLRMFATDLNTCMPKEFSAELTPEAEILKALRASMSIPVYFTPSVDTTGHLLVDGGVVTHNPFLLMSSAERETTLCITFSYREQVDSIPTLFSFLAQVYSSLHRYHAKAMSTEWSERIVNIPCGEFPSTHFEATTEEKIALMDLGRKGMESFLAKVSGRAPPRRFSVT